MANVNKRKGDRAERAVRDYVVERWPGSFKTRAGFTEDLGDVIVEHPAGRVVIQVKDVSSPAWKTWYQQLRDQVLTCRRESQRATIGGVIVHKYRGHSDPAKWHAVAPLGDLMDLIEEAYQAGVEHGQGAGYPYTHTPVEEG